MDMYTPSVRNVWNKQELTKEAEFESIMEANDGVQLTLLIAKILSVAIHY